ncbi:hypothetical protein AB0I82_23270 [Streptomyces sp. NPDC050315]|uniref:hypothetical protein n=1 Tax=Streptomyces sp. NPDC050315 TaxID=3155039 RepID=UPI0034187B2B
MLIDESALLMEYAQNSSNMIESGEADVHDGDPDEGPHMIAMRLAYLHVPDALLEQRRRAPPGGGALRRIAR